MTGEMRRSEDEIVRDLRAAGCVFAEDEASLLVSEAQTSAQLDDWVERRVAGEPLEVIVGWAEFHGLRIGIDAGVFVPRRRTEFLVDLAIATVGTTLDPVVVDLCCGSGALGMAVAAAIPTIQLFASDIEPATVACARRNLTGIGSVFEGDLFGALPSELRGAITLLLVNAPYVPTDELGHLPPEARLFEPRVALDGGGDGLDVHRRVARDAPSWLAPGGTILIETGDDQADQAAAMFESSGLRPRIEFSDDADATVVLATRPRP